MIETINPNTSAIGTAIHSPVPFKNRGNIIIAPDKNNKVLENDIRADVFPSERAVNKFEAKTLYPTTKKE